LQQSRDTAAHRAHPCLIVKLHGFLLLLHGIVLKFLVEFRYLGLQDLHFCLRQVGFVGNRRHCQADQDGHYHNGHPKGDERTEKAVEGGKDITVDPSENSPAVRDGIGQAELLVLVEYRYVCWPIVQVHGIRQFSAFQFERSLRSIFLGKLLGVGFFLHKVNGA